MLVVFIILCYILTLLYQTDPDTMLTVVPSLFKGGSIVPAGKEDTPDFFIVYEHDTSKLNLSDLPPWKARFSSKTDAEHYANLQNGVRSTIVTTPAQAAEALDSLDNAARMSAGINAYEPREVLQRFIREVADTYGFEVPGSAQIALDTDLGIKDSEVILLRLGLGSEARKQVFLVFPQGWDRSGFSFYPGHPDRLEFLYGLKHLGVDQIHREIVMRLFNAGRLHDARQEAARSASSKFTGFVQATRALSA